MGAALSAGGGGDEGKGHAEVATCATGVAVRRPARPVQRCGDHDDPLSMTCGAGPREIQRSVSLDRA